MKIGVLNWRDLGHPAAGGAEVFVHEVGRRWVADGHEVLLVSSRDRALGARGERDGVRIVRVGKLHNGSHHAMAPRYLRDKTSVDVVLESINTVPYMLPLRRRFPPFASLVHQLARDVWRWHLPLPAATAAERGEPFLYRPYRRERMLAVSPSTSADLVATGIDRTDVVPMGGIGRVPLEEKTGVPTLLFVGRLAENKRPGDAVEAFRHVRAKFPEARLWIVGTGPLEQEVRRRLPPGAEMLRTLERSDLLHRMSTADLLVIASVREGWGMVVTEANALGTPAVAYDVPGLRDSVRDGVTGLLTREDPRAMADAIVELLSDRSRYDALRDNAIGWGQSFSWDKTAEVLLRSLEERLAKPGGVGV